MLPMEYSRKFRDILTLQEEIAASVVGEIRSQFDLGDRVHGSQSEVDPQAYEAYLRGLYLLNRRESFTRAVDYFRSAVETAPDYPLSYAYLAHALLMRSAYDNLPPTEVVPEARQAVLRALELNPNLPEGFAALAMIEFSYDWEYQSAESHLLEAVSLRPEYATAHHWYGLLLAARGRLDSALEQILEAKRLEPHSPVVSSALGRIHYYRYEFGEAEQVFREAIELEQGFVPAHLALGLLFLSSNRLDEALLEFEQGLAGTQAFERLLDAAQLAMKDEENLAKAELIGMLKGGNLASEPLYVSPMTIVVLSLVLGEKELALSWLDRAVADHSDYLPFVAVDPVFESLRDDPEFDSILERINLR
jgi:tetratricopeptide (TPR) repeat protein